MIRVLRAVPTAGVGLLALALVACNHLKPHTGCDLDGPGACAPGDDCLAHAKVCKNPTVLALAHDLDHLEKHIDWYGSVVAKVPDVWGQARLTQYRWDFEKELVKDLPKFEATLQGSLSRTDQSFFMFAAAISTAAGGQPISAEVPGVVVAPPPAPVVVNPPDKPDPGSGGGSAAGAGAKGGDEKPTTDPAAGFFEGRLRFNPANFNPGLQTQGGSGIALEPTLILAQKKRYLDFLNQIRRENEGDDTADSPGYSLNLVRIPVSVLPGKRTDVGFGAEITFTLDPVLGDELLPATFRNFVVNDLLHQLGVPLAQFLNDRDLADQLLTVKVRDELLGLDILNHVDVLARAGRLDELGQYLGGLTPEETERLHAALHLLTPEQRADLLTLLHLLAEFRKDPSGKAADAAVRARAAEKYATTAKTAGDPVRQSAARASGAARLHDFTVKLAAPSLPFSPGLANKTGFPTSQLLDVYGLHGCFEIAYRANLALKESIERQRYAHLPDIQGFLQQEVVAAQRFLADPECADLWADFCTPDLVSAVRTRKLDRLQDYREKYRAAVKKITEGKPTARADRPSNPPGEYSLTAALAWCVLVDSALLTDRLARDMKEASAARGRLLPGADVWLPYFLPCPPPEARAAFAEYVRVRWPIHVFALDPYTQDQNLADSLLTRRETQLALATAFAGGFISARTMTRYSRRLEAEYETIALNRTQVGFAHGENTFGWRFYPRFQTPDTEGNLTVLLRDQLVGGPNRNALLRQRRLEPGPRECVAVVLMPSFVPYVTVDSVSNWFPLANPKHKVLDHAAAVRMSKTVKTLQKCETAVADADCYRDGELRRLQVRVEQLASRLPTQTLGVPVPVLNTYGGFEMFANGTTDLAPELYGWYGAPGVGVGKGRTTTLFLVGDHFSTLRSKVIVGNRPATVFMLSRQVMRVDVPGDVLTVADPDGRLFAQAHVATPYGVSRELLIPVVADQPVPDGFYLEPARQQLGITAAFTPGNPDPSVTPLKTSPVVVRGVFASGAVPKQIALTLDADGFDPIAVKTAVAADADGRYTVAADALKDAAAEYLKQVLNKARAAGTPIRTPAELEVAAARPVRLKAAAVTEGAQPAPQPVIGELRIRVTATVAPKADAPAGEDEDP